MSNNPKGGILTKNKIKVIGDLKLNEKGLIPAIIQDDDTGEVLMLGYMNEESLRLTQDTGEVWFFSRSRQALWHKGETSGNRLYVRSIWLDCDKDTVLVRAHPSGPVCHTGSRTCFFQELAGSDSTTSPAGEA
jgi:phosphoribosyl-AMP cyclohydrolase